MSKIVITTFGSLGDLHPYIAIALGLRERGHEVVIGTSPCYRQKVESLGLVFPKRTASWQLVMPWNLCFPSGHSSRRWNIAIRRPDGSVEAEPDPWEA